MTQSPPLHVHELDFDKLLAVLEVVVYGLTRVVLAEDGRATVPATDACFICMGVGGKIRLMAPGSLVTTLDPGDVIVLPARQGLSLGIQDAVPLGHTLDLSSLRRGAGGKEVSRWFSPEKPGRVEFVCGYFRGAFASTVDIFAGMATPIVERFCRPSRMGTCLEDALEEFHSCEIGSAAMATALFKQALICVFRQRLKSTDEWVRSMALFRDPQIARAFGDMVARPGAQHTVASLAATANLSRSAFMARFSQSLGDSPMAVLRVLRMQKALHLIAAETLAPTQIADAVGYGSRYGFVRAFRQVYGRNPWPEGC